MKTLRFFGTALMAMAFALTMSSCENDNNKENTPTDPYKDYAELIVGKWFDFTPITSVFADYRADNTFNIVGLDNEYGYWLQNSGTYRLEGNKIIESYTKIDGSHAEVIKLIEIKEDKLVLLSNSGAPGVGQKVNYRVKESFDIKGNYSYLNSVARVVAAEGKTALQLPEGVTFNGENSISIDAMHGERIIAAMQKFFADATFGEEGKLNHTMDGEAKEKSYTLDGNNLTFDLYEGGTYKVNAMSFPDEDGDRLFIIIPKQTAWLGGMVELVEKENEGLTLNAEQIAALEKEFMETFDTFTVIISLSKQNN